MNRLHLVRTLSVPVLATLSAPFLHADYPGEVLADEPLVYYRFEEPAGATTIIDSSGNGLNINYSTPVGTTQLGVAGAVGLAAMFNADDAIITPLVFDPSSGDFTLEAIINPNMVPGAIGVILANRNGGGVGRSNLLVSETSQVAAFSGGAPTDSGFYADNGTFYHVVLSYDRSAVGSASDPTFRFYIDGIERDPSMLAVEPANGEWVIGSNKDLITQQYSGLLDEVAIYSRRLDDPDGDGDTSDSRIGAHYGGYLSDSDVLVTFESDTAYIDSGQSANLSWFVSPALTSLTLSDGINPPVDVLGNVVGYEGMHPVSPTVTTTYTLVGTSPIGTESLQFTLVVDEPAVVDSFTSSVPTVPAGASVELAWALTNAVTVEIDNGVGAVDRVSGTATVVVDADTTFTLSATNSQGVVTATVTVTVQSVDPSLVAHWRVGETPEEIAGRMLMSETGTTFDGTFFGTPRFDTNDPAPVPGGSTASLVFDGADSWVDVLNYNGVGGTNGRTMAFWFKGSATQRNDGGTLISWGANFQGNRWDTRVNNNPSGVLRTEVTGSGSDGTAKIADDTWHHCAVVFDGSTIGDVQFYVDGALDSISSAGTTAVNSTTNLNLRIGASRTLLYRSLSGKLDDIRIYDRVLGGDEILALVEPSIPLAPEFTEFAILENGDVEIGWAASPGDYTVQYSYDLQSWFDLAKQSIPPGETSTVTIDVFDDPPAAQAGVFKGIRRVFYRIPGIEEQRR